MMKRTIRNAGLVLIGLTAILSAGCLFEKLAWSPDGKSLLYAAGDDTLIWRYDVATGALEGRKLHIGHSSKVYACRWTPKGDRAVVLFENGDDDGEIFLFDPSREGSGNCKWVDGQCSPFFDVAPDGSVYYAKEKKKDSESTYELWRFRGGKSGKVWTAQEELGFVRVAPKGERMLFTVDDKLCMLNIDDLSTRTLIDRSEVRSKDNGIFWPVWLDNDRFIYTEQIDGVSGNLCLYDFDGATTRSLAWGASIIDAPSVAPDGKTVAVTSCGRKPGEEADSDLPGQIYFVDIATGKKEKVTSEDFGAGTPSLSPDGKRLAYLTGIPGADDKELSPMLCVRDLETGRDTFTWRSEPERLYATALTLKRGGQLVEAMAMLKDLAARFEETPFHMASQWQMLKLYLDGPLEDIDEAYAIYTVLDVDTDDMFLCNLFWRETDRIATDPAGDLITTYATEASNEKWTDSDAARDLTGLWVRVGEKRVYIRLDYASDRDLTGIALQDTAILLTGGLCKKDSTEIAPGIAWDRNATRVATIRHWFKSALNSQFDMDIRNGVGEIAACYLASGFEPPVNPIMECVGLYNGDGAGSAVYAFDRKTLGIIGEGEMNIQACTFKGGIDTLETPAAAPALCDAFGADNTDPATLHGVAATFGYASPNGFRF